jgi:hypothetical protein
MNWRKGLLRLWVVGTAIWIVSAIILVFQYAAEDPRIPGIVVPDRVFEASTVVRAADIYVSYWYYRIIRPGVAAEAHRVMDLSCKTSSQVARDEADLREHEAEEKKEPPRPPHELSRSDLDRLLMNAVPECSAEVEKAKYELGDIAALPASVEDGGWAPEALLSFAYWLFGPPIVALVVSASLIWAFRWAFRGFRIG